jgi:hypothetical protein
MGLPLSKAAQPKRDVFIKRAARIGRWKAMFFFMPKGRALWLQEI